ncbi:MAG: DUF4292 domain-containing protein [Deltaproteobacteria bacterium]|nr:DUF4292 domain-containing protein [Deltaproteobacteria bacterium]MBI4374750.1 DUF4292 domain-containing protein [Deltaproteobacteria bacterium]
MKKPSRILIDLLLILAFFSSCVSRQRISTGLPSELKGLVVRSLKEREGNWSRLRGTARLKLGRKNQGEVLVLAKKPLDFRFDLVSDFGYYLQQIVSRSGFLTVVWYGDDRYFQGVGSAEQLRKHLSIGLTPGEVVQILLGQTPLGDEEEYRLSSTRKEDQFLLRDERSEMIVLKRGNDYLPLKYTALDIGGERLYSVTYDDYSSDGFPYRIRGRFRGTESEILFQEVELNPPLSHDLFEIEIPKGMRRIYE